MKFYSLFALALPASAVISKTACKNENLKVDVYHAPTVPVSYQGNRDLSFSPTPFTLIHSAHEAVLVDSPTLNTTAEDIAKWIAKTAPGKKLTYIYITHGHFDHYGAFATIQKHFPSAKVVAKKDVIEHMHEQIEPPLWDTFWLSLFPGLDKPSLDSVVQLPDNGKFYLEHKHELRAVEVGESDTKDTTVLHVPDIGLVVGGDVIYGHCYQYLAENPTPELQAQWIRSLEKVKALKPKFVVPSHAQASEGFGLKHLNETEAYIEKWGTWVKKSKTWQELEGFAKEEYPDRIGDFILRYSAQSFFNATF